MATTCEQGATLAESLSLTRLPVESSLVAALAVGEERGDLPGTLAAFALRHDPHPSQRLAARVGRRPEVTQFAAALARLLKDRPLTVSLVEDAARLASSDGSAFNLAVSRLAKKMRDGTQFAQALATEPRLFDPLFCTLIAAADQRHSLRTILAQIAAVPDTTLNTATKRGT